MTPRECHHEMWPRCGCDVTPRDQRATTPIPPPDRVAAYVRAVDDMRAALTRSEALWAQMSPAERLAVAGYTRPR